MGCRGWRGGAGDRKGARGTEEGGQETEEGSRTVGDPGVVPSWVSGSPGVADLAAQGC